MAQREKLTGLTILCAWVLAVTLSNRAGAALSVDGDLPTLYFGDEPAFGYGPSPQHVLTYLPSGNGNDYRSWAEWAARYRMNHVRSYPPSFIVEAPAINLFHRSTQDPDRFDLSRFNQAYFDELGRACRLLKEKGFFVHLQLWQSVYWKKRWPRIYYNPANNVNPDISREAGRGKFMVLGNEKLLQHQISYVHKILDATARLGNVYYDIANEIGNGTGHDPAWVMRMIDAVREWETSNGHDVLLTINDEGGKRVAGIDEILPQMDLVVKDLGRWDEHVAAREKFRKPTVSVRNIDWDFANQQRRYFFGPYNLETNTDRDLQTRGRKYWWRMFMARVQMAGGYADAYDESRFGLWARISNKLLRILGVRDPGYSRFAPSYPLNTLAERNFLHFRNFVDKLTDYPNLQPSDDVVEGHPAAHKLALQSTREAIFYLESPNGRSGYEYAAGNVILSGLLLDDGNYNGSFYFPESGRSVDFAARVTTGRVELSLPSFGDDLAILLQRQ